MAVSTMAESVPNDQDQTSKDRILLLKTKSKNNLNSTLQSMGLTMDPVLRVAVSFPSSLTFHGLEKAQHL